MSGPVPKRSEDRRRYDAADKPDIKTGEAYGITEWPEANENWHPIAKNFYDSLQRSGQVKFYEDSDVAYAYFVCEGMSRCLGKDKQISAQMFQAVLSGTNNLLVTEADRRRLRVELGRPDKVKDAEATDEMLADYKDELADILPLRKES